MDSPLILCNIQKCALEQVQAAVEQFGRSDTKHSPVKNNHLMLY